MLDFEWDEEKNAINAAKHGWLFSDAISVFDDPYVLESEDRSMRYGEMRMVVTGLALGRLVTLIYTERRHRLRIISARKATPKERFEYEKTPR